jgi:hypothetical protein
MAPTSASRRRGTVKRNGKLVGVDVDRLLRRADQAREALRHRAGL